VTSDGEPDIPQNLLDANSIVSFDWVLFRPVKVCPPPIRLLRKNADAADYKSNRSWQRYYGCAEPRKRD
jgi:hypothetical protein